MTPWQKKKKMVKLLQTELRPLYFENITGNDLFSDFSVEIRLQSNSRFIDIPVLAGAYSLFILSIYVFVEIRLNFPLISKKFMSSNVCFYNIDTGQCPCGLWRKNKKI